MKYKRTKALFTSARNTWRTPEELYRMLDAEFNFDSDGAPADFENAPLFNEQLSRSWRGRRVFCNPPYGPNILPFLKKASGADVAVFLLPARTDTKWFHEIALPLASEIRFVRGRLKFANAEGVAKHSAPFPSMLVIFRRGKE